MARNEVSLWVEDVATAAWMKRRYVGRARRFEVMRLALSSWRRPQAWLLDLGRGNQTIRQGASFFSVEAVDPDRAVKVIEWRHGIRPIEDLSPVCEIC